MRDRKQILAEIFDCLVKHDSGKIPSEVGELFLLGVRLHNECPDVDPDFREALGRRLKQEWTARVAEGRPAGLPGLLALAKSLRLGRALRPLAAIALVLCLALLPAALFPPAPCAVDAGLSRAIAVFGGAIVEQNPRGLSTPPAIEPLGCFATIEEAEAAGFALPAPSYLPAGFALQRVSVVRHQGQLRAALYYVSSQQEAPYGRRGAAASDLTRTILVQQLQTQQTLEEAAFTLEVGPDSVERLQVAGRTALWAAGSWNAGGGWVRMGAEGTLILQDDDLLLMVSSELGREENVRIAESMLP